MGVSAVGILVLARMARTAIVENPMLREVEVESGCRENANIVEVEAEAVSDIGTRTNPIIVPASVVFLHDRVERMDLEGACCTCAFKILVLAMLAIVLYAGGFIVSHS